MFEALLVLLSALSLVGAWQTEIRHQELNGAHLIDTSPNNYAISSPNLLQSDWKTVSINGNKAIIFSPTCQMSTREVVGFTPDERSLIARTRAELESLAAGNQPALALNGQSRYSSSRFSLTGTQLYSNSGHNINFSTFQNNGFSISKNDDNNFSVSKPDLPENMVRIFVNSDVVTYVYSNGFVQMKPSNCLKSGEQELIRQLKAEAQQAEQQFKQNMQNMQQNLQQSMQNMQQNMQNIFGPGFPFNRGHQVHSQPYGQYLQNSAGAFGVPTQSPYVYPPYNPYTSYQVAQPGPQMFGNNFPFGPNNFPFGPNNSPFGNRFPTFG